MGARRKARELALQMLYQHDLSGNPPDTIVDTFEELQKANPNTREFASRIFHGTLRSKILKCYDIFSAVFICFLTVLICELLLVDVIVC